MRVLIEHLPAESATMTAIRNDSPGVGSGADPAEGRWSQLEMLMAALVDEMRILRWLYVSANTEKAKPKQPTPIRRPGVDDGKPKKQKLSPYKAAFLFNHINGLSQDGPDLTVIDGGV